MLSLRALGVQELPPTPAPGLFVRGTMPLPNHRALKSGAELTLITPDGEIPLGVALSGSSVSFVLDAFGVPRVLLTNVNRVIEVNYEAGHARVLLERPTALWEACLPLPDGALVTVDVSPYGTIRRWECDDAGTWTERWSVEAGAVEKLSTLASGRVLVAHYQDDPETAFLAMSPDGLRPLCALENRLVATMDHNGMALVELEHTQDDTVHWWFELQNIDAAIRASSGGPLLEFDSNEVAEHMYLTDPFDEEEEEEEEEEED